MSYSISTIGGIKNAVLVKLGQATTSAYYTDAILDDWIDDAHKFATSYKKWSFTEGRISTTFSTSITDDLNNYIMEYPEGWKADSIRLLQIGGKTYDKKNFYQFMKYREENPSDNEEIYSDYARRIYVNSVASPSGTMTCYGQYMPVRLDGTDPSTGTIFSNYDEDGNQAIVQEVLSYAAQREKKPQVEIQSYHQMAIEILDRLWNTIAGEQAMYQPTDGEGMWRRIDVVNGTFGDDLNSNKFN